MNITFFHKTNSGYTTKIFSDAKVRIFEKVMLSDKESQSDKSAVIRIFTNDELEIYPNDRCVFFETHEKNPPGGAFVVQKVCDNRQGVLSHIRIDCVC